MAGTYRQCVCSREVVRESIAQGSCLPFGDQKHLTESINLVYALSRHLRGWESGQAGISASWCWGGWSRCVWAAAVGASSPLRRGGRIALCALDWSRTLRHSLHRYPSCTHSRRGCCGRSAPAPSCSHLSLGSLPQEVEDLENRAPENHSTIWVMQCVTFRFDDGWSLKCNTD